MPTRFTTTLLRPILVSVLIAICVWLSGRSLCFALQPLPDDMHAAAIASIDFVYQEKFKQAEDEAKKIIRKYPDHPAGYFFQAAAIASWMEYYQSDKREDEFYRACDMAIEKGERLLDRDPGNAWVKFFTGGADGYKGTYESRYERWITSFRHGWKGVSTLMQLARSAPDMHDVNYGLGTYHYWRSALSKMLWWMPNVENKTELGIRQLLDAKAEGVYTKVPASVNLVIIFNRQKRYDEALALCDEMRKQYPTALVFCWGKAEALFGCGRYEEARHLYEYILGRVEQEAIDNHYNAVLCHLWLAKIYQAEKHTAQSIVECARMSAYSLDEPIKKRLEKCFTEAGALKKQDQMEQTSQPVANASR